MSQIKYAGYASSLPNTDNIDYLQIATYADLLIKKCCLQTGA